MEFKPGDQVGHFRIEQVIGRGGSATVYRANDPRFGGPVAVKVLASHLVHEPDAVEHFVTEARSLRRVDHDSLITVFDVSTTDDGRPYMVLRYADRGSLLDRLPANPGREVELSALVDFLSTSLGALHRQDLIHRDVKPSNVLLASVPDEDNDDTRPTEHGSFLRADERPLLGDLGLVKDLSKGAVTRGAGSHGYAAPEQRAVVSRVDRRTDVFGASAVVAEVALGRVRRPDESWPELLDALGRSSSPTRAALAKQLATGLADDPDDRFSSIDEWRIALSDALAGVKSGPQRARRHVATLLVGSVAALIVLATLIWQFSGSNNGIDDAAASPVGTETPPATGTAVPPATPTAQPPDDDGQRQSGEPIVESTKDPTTTPEPSAPEPTATPEPATPQPEEPEPDTPVSSAAGQDNPEPEETTTPLPEATEEPTATSSPTPEPTVTPDPTSTPAPTAEPTATPAPTAEPTATPAPTTTPEPTATAEPTPTPEPTATPSPQDLCPAWRTGVMQDLTVVDATDTTLTFDYPPVDAPIAIFVDGRYHDNARRESNQYVIEGLLAGQQHGVTFAIGTEALTDGTTRCGETLASPPGRPPVGVTMATDLFVTSDESGTATLNWTPPSTGGSAYTAYRGTLAPGKSFPDITGDGGRGFEVTSYTFTELVPGETVVLGLRTIAGPNQSNLAWIEYTAP